MCKCDAVDKNAVALCFDTYGDDFEIGMTRLALVQEKNDSSDGMAWEDLKADVLFVKKVSVFYMFGVCVV